MLYLIIVLNGYGPRTLAIERSLGQGLTTAVEVYNGHQQSPISIYDNCSVVEVQKS